MYDKTVITPIMTQWSSKIIKKYIHFDSDDKHVHCLAHIINLAAQQVLATLKATENENFTP
ncbi:hypothetical protein RhiirC2_787269 [Rhizophagus irregularis]|uniref:Uncharacterized protein n=1 Tax=Rhizophagus irregularis TaxID=588596 RepID=A0A2N1MSH6_9GLOM|nr:hypothetical protein RhiirC2_787269 [Rhizophagus irregularis]